MILKIQAVKKFAILSNKLRVDFNNHRQELVNNDF